MGDRHLPVIYVRGYAGGQDSIDKAVDDPFAGFNEGSVHVRVGARGRPAFYQFEGPLVRLVNEEGYSVHVKGSQERYLRENGDINPNSLWIYRFYDSAASTFERPGQRYDIEEAAENLAAYIELVRSKTVGNPPVYLVAHSMGGLICRTALQRFMMEPEKSVAKLCTIGTPHGGIDIAIGGGLGDLFLRLVGPAGSNIFSPPNMMKYMYPGGHEHRLPKVSGSDRKVSDPKDMSGAFGPDRVLSIVGTDERDYPNRASAVAMGPQSDGLVAIKNAYVRGSARSYVHRAHSGRYGLVNSEEAYQNLKRFLFGGLRVNVGIEGATPIDDKTVYQAEVRLAIRGLPVLIHEQTAEHYCPIDLNAETTKFTGDSLPLVSSFLMTGAADRPAQASALRYALDLKVASLKEESGIFLFGSHLEQVGDWRDALIVDVALDGQGTPSGMKYAWNSLTAGRPGEQELTADAAPRRDGDLWRARVPLPPAAQEVLGRGAALGFEIADWPARAG